MPAGPTLTKPPRAPYDDFHQGLDHQRAEVAELADALGSGPSSRNGSGGSSPLFGTYLTGPTVLLIVGPFPSHLRKKRGQDPCFRDPVPFFSLSPFFLCN